MRVELRYFDGCPNWRVTEQRLRSLADELGFEVVLRRVETPDEAEALDFRGSPSVIVDGADPFATGSEPVGLACRLYDTPEGTAGSPTTEQLREVLA